MKRIAVFLCVLLVIGLPMAFAGGTREAKTFEVAVSLPGSVEFFSVPTLMAYGVPKHL